MMTTKIAVKPYFQLISPSIFSLFLCRRIAFCLDVYNESVRSMSYPPDAYKKDLKNAQKASPEEEKSIDELIKEMEDDFDE